MPRSPKGFGAVPVAGGGREGQPNVFHAVAKAVVWIAALAALVVLLWHLRARRDVKPNIAVALRLSLAALLGTYALGLTLIGVVFYSSRSMPMPAVLGVIALQLVVDAKPAAWHRKAARAWAVVLALETVAIVYWAARARAADEVSLGVWAAAILGVMAYLVGWWWPKALEREDPEGIRPGYLIGGATWSLLVVVDLGRAAWLVLSGPPPWQTWTEPGAIYGYWHELVPLLGILILPIWAVVPMRVLYAGLRRHRGDTAAYKQRTALLIAMEVCSALGLFVAIGLGLESSWPAPRAIATGVVGSVVAWVAALMWIRNLRKGARRDLVASSAP
ncbi:MAG: hypothetical protein JSV65_15635 [Armatimonadota bacterium]|nr:MAG: hypothetical protein JSV65_15635 [Armatimonadota bacterium]